MVVVTIPGTFVYVAVATIIAPATHWFVTVTDRNCGPGSGAHTMFVPVGVQSSGGLPLSCAFPLMANNTSKASAGTTCFRCILGFIKRVLLSAPIAGVLAARR